MAMLERRIEALERRSGPDDRITVIAIQSVSPGDLKPENRFCWIDGVTHHCGSDELPADFDNRMRAVAEDLNRRLGRTIRIICSPVDFDL